jgi:ATP-dependent DNA helicase RecG
MISTTELTRELLYQIRIGEDSAYEFKRVIFTGNKLTDPHPDSLANELAAFANGSGGTVVLGVEDKTRELSGIPPDRLDLLDKCLSNIATDLIHPPLQIETRALELPDAAGNLRLVTAVRVHKSLFVHRSPGGYFHRVGSSRREMPPELLARMFQQRSMARLIRFDEQAVPNAAPEHAATELKARFLKADLPEALQLRRLHLLAGDDDGGWSLSVCGVLLVTPRPADWLSSAYVQCVAYRGSERNAEHQVDAQDCDGPLDQQIAQAFVFVKRNMRVEAVKRPGRIDIPQYDLRAVYEALVNAVAHRDYSMHGARVRVHLFADRMEISTPGGLPNSLSVDSMDSNSITRNETLVNLLSRYYPADPATGRQSLIERRGEGVPTILAASERLSLRRPVYENIDHMELKLTIFAASKERNGVLPAMGHLPGLPSIADGEPGSQPA